MAGMGLGSWWSLRRAAGLRTLAGLQGVAALAPLVLYAVFEGLARVQNAAGVFLASQILFPVLAVLSGLLAGYQFPVASRIFFARGGGSPGTLYALDLMGACLGALALSLYLVPVFGFLKTALLMAEVAAISLAGCVRRRPGP
jgi:predicted membrane-bound spermidine synthase